MAAKCRGPRVCSGRIGVVINLLADQVADLPIDQLGLLILSDLLKTNEWNEYNYLLGAQ
jgi:hypothetical protein